MTNPATASIETTQAAIKARWGFDSRKTDLSFNDSISMEQVVEHLTETYSAFHKAFACAKAKILHLKQRMQNATLHNFIARLMPCKNQVSRAHRSTAKSTKNSSSSDSSDGSDPDPETLLSDFITPLTNSIIPKAFFAHISITEVAK
ncbi:hypothetical protein ODU92_004416 [Salmonella enterica]|uniref:Uncharacterized protein n=4 Tax=Salmonella enterica TaxID=28901 RepID=A0A3Y9C3U2_SALEB|nr:hypothetical protein [Salmonella enterica subsp. enterica serovar Java]EAA3226726.1 hypothetical protein [Salmonella enterica subsp. enterica serovar Newport]EAN9726986.1 hypothetical protein [Salmonella enterica]EBU8670959.1 hypothetical protein [Salmonella enterica subsp. enterica serovar Panama]EBV8393914.1 hypothetical protein [Salmonella enterica subsp. enterica serovar Virchow]EBV8521395.1 hypothetical protein [Salmonella enterica subsp. enterica serovar Larochelle]ECA3793129.1 hypot